MDKTELVGLYGEFWRVPRDWGEESMADGTSTLPAWLRWAREVSAVVLREVFTRLAQDEQRGPTLWRVRTLYAERAGRRSGGTPDGAVCFRCANSGYVLVLLDYSTPVPRLITRQSHPAAGLQPGVSVAPCSCSVGQRHGKSSEHVQRHAYPMGCGDAERACERFRVACLAAASTPDPAADEPADGDSGIAF